jgi:purine-nucleoside phosphorylase
MDAEDSTPSDLLASAVKSIRRKWSCDATMAVVLGTGLGELADEVQSATAIDYRNIPGFPCSTALAHRGRLVCGELAGAPVMMLQGRCHLYEGYSLADVTFPLRVLAALGIKSVVITNAAGGLNPAFSTGDVMLIDAHINLMNWSSERCGEVLRSAAAAGCAAPAYRGPLYDPDLGGLAAATARRGSFVLQRGTYVAVSGPSYETRAEYRAFRRIGGDCVGMSTVPEVLAAAACGLHVLALSTVTNVASPDVPKKVTAEEVVEVAAIARPRVGAIVEAVVGFDERAATA